MREFAGDSGSVLRGARSRWMLGRQEIISWRVREVAVCCSWGEESSCQSRPRIGIRSAEPSIALLEAGIARFLRKERVAWRRALSLLLRRVFRRGV